MDFFGKTDSIILLGVKTTINPQNSIKIVDEIFEKTGIFIFLFLCELSLISGAAGKLKIGLQISNFNYIGQLV